MLFLIGAFDVTNFISDYFCNLIDFIYCHIVDLELLFISPRFNEAFNKVNPSFVFSLCGQTGCQSNITIQKIIVLTLV